jgi:hypothetical protein
MMFPGLGRKLVTLSWTCIRRVPLIILMGPPESDWDLMRDIHPSRTRLQCDLSIDVNGESTEENFATDVAIQKFEDTPATWT